MYGLANIAIEQLVCNNFGTEAWAAIKKKAGVNIESFSRMSPYPDEITFQLIGAAVEVLKIPPDDLMRTFGEFWAHYTPTQGYGYLFDMAGGSLIDFLYNLDNLHSRVGQNLPHLVPPSFRFDDLGNNRYRMHYHSERFGLCNIVVGVLKGLSDRFKTPLDVTHPTCQRNGADHCEFELTVGERNG